MTWKTTGSISDRLRSLEMRTEIMKSNDPMMASRGTQIPMNTPGPNGIAKEEGAVPQEFKGAGLSQGAPLSTALSGLKQAFRITDTGIAQVNSILAQYGDEGVLSSTYQGLLDSIDQYHGLMKKMEQGLTKLIQDSKTQALVNNDPAQSVNAQGNADMQAMQMQGQEAPQAPPMMDGGGMGMGMGGMGQ